MFLFQSLKPMFLKFLNGAALGLTRPVVWRKYFKNIDFSLWGNHATTCTHIIYCTIFPFLAYTVYDGNISVYLLFISGSGSEELNKKILPALIRGVLPYSLSSLSTNVFCRSCLTSAKFPPLAAFHNCLSLPPEKQEKKILLLKIIHLSTFHKQYQKFRETEFMIWFHYVLVHEW